MRLRDTITGEFFRCLPPAEAIDWATNDAIIVFYMEMPTIFTCGAYLSNPTLHVTVLREDEN